MGEHTAPITSVFNTVGTHVVQNGDTIKVFSIIISNETGGVVEVNFYKTGTTDAYISPNTPLGNTRTDPATSWLAGSGLDVKINDANVTVSVFHSHGGG
jgi:hypothetical protein